MRFKIWLENRGLYGQPEGPTSHANATVDRYDVDNRIAEDDHVEMLINFWRAGNFKAYNDYVEKLRADGHSLDRIYSMMNRSQAKQGIPSRNKVRV